MFSYSDVEDLLPKIKDRNWNSQPLNEVEKIKRLTAPAIIFSPLEEVIVFINNIKEKSDTIITQSLFLNIDYRRIVESDFHLFICESDKDIWSQYQLISFDNAPKYSGKDFCHHCNSSNLYWVMMAARCRNCDRIILGG